MSKVFFMFCLVVSLVRVISAEDKVDVTVIEFSLERSVNTNQDNLRYTSDQSGIIVENDIVLGFSKDRGAFRVEASTWPNNELVYDLDPSFEDDYDFIQGITAAIKVLEKNSNVKFKRRLYEQDYVFVTRDNGCYSMIGRVGGAQTLSLGEGCTETHTVIHEFMHALGFLHEHTRFDRDQYIKILKGNLGPYGVTNFTVLRQKAIGVYDYNSIMHYPSYAYYPFAKSEGVPMFVKTSDGMPMTEQNTTLSYSDIEMLDAFYPAKKTNPNGEVTCLPIIFANKNSFSKELGKAIHDNLGSSGKSWCVVVTFEKEYTLEVIPERLNDWLSQIQETGGTVKKIEVSRSWLRKIFEFIIKILTGKENNDAKVYARHVNAEIYFDKDTQKLIEVKFLPR